MPQVKLHTTGNSKRAGYILPASDPTASSSSTPLLQSVSEHSHHMSAHIETLDSDHDDCEGSHQPHVTPSGSTPNKGTRMMIKAIDAIIKLNIPSKVKLCDPDPFDGSDPRQLHTFLLQCKLHKSLQ